MQTLGFRSQSDSAFQRGIHQGLQAMCCHAGDFARHQGTGIGPGGFPTHPGSLAGARDCLCNDCPMTFKKKSIVMF